MKRSAPNLVLLLPVVFAFGLFLVAPLSVVVMESLREFVPGRVGSAADAPFTLENYRELFDPAYLFYFWDTLRFAFLTSILAIAIGYPIAYLVTHLRSKRLRAAAIAFLISMMFLSALVRVYSIQLALGPVGLMRPLSAFLGLPPNSATYTEIMVIAGLLHYFIPITALTLVGTLQNLNPRLVEAAQALGAGTWRAHLSVTLPLSMPGVLSAFVICYTLSISAFVVPMILGKGRILFVSNLIYSRFSEVANYPSGAAISIVMLIVSLLIVFLIFRAAKSIGRTA